MDFNQQLENLFKKLDKFTDKSGTLLKQKIKDSAEKFDSELIKLLLGNKDSKAHFFDEIAQTTVFNYRKFIDYIDDKNFLLNSYTKFSNKIGLTISHKHIKQIDDVVLSFPFKDCVLEGGQTKDAEKRKEIFFNEILAKDEITRLLDKKVIINAKKYTQNNISDEVNFKRDENGLIKDNLIIKGNNLLALHTIKSNFAGKIKLIYIDPPYNTGNDSFNYNDNFNHSTWLVFMKNRLEIAKELLSDDGVIFVQCDDNEQAYLKVLMDEIFGRDSFITNFLWEKTQHFGRQKLNYYSNCEYIIIYAKELSNGENIKQLLIEKYLTDFDDAPLYNASNPEKVLSFPERTCKFKIADGLYSKTSDNKYQLQNKVIVKNSTNENTFKIKFKSRWTDTTLQDEIRKGGKILIKSDKFSPRIIYHDDKSSFASPKQIIFTNQNNPLNTNVLDFKVGTTANGSEENISLFGKKLFNYPKPESLLGYLIEISTKKGDIVLDYHLGSGTTTAVAHKMGRQYIGIEQMDYIEDITVKRMQKVIAGEQGGISKNINWQGGGTFIYFELAKYNQQYIDNLNAIKQGHGTAKTIEQLYNEIVNHAFLNYDVESDKLLANKTDFLALGFEAQLDFLLAILNKNQLYKNLSEIDDKDLSVNDKTKALNKGFYKE